VFKFLAKWGTEGIKFPLAFDGAKPASARLLFSHVSFWIASVLLVMNKEQTWTAIAFFSICTLLYMFKEVDKFKFSAKDQTVEVEDTQDEEK
jgi:Ca2+/Na+ antiporter